MYVWLKSLHVVVTTLWTATMLVTPPLLVAFARRDGAADRAELATLRRLFSGLGTPALLLTFALGITMGVQAGWFHQGWLHVKLTLVVVLAGLHGVISGQLRRAATKPGHVVPGWVGRLHWAVAVLLVFIVALSVGKPTRG